MNMTPNFFLYLLTMAGVTYLIRMLPLVLVKKKIKNRFVLSFLYYVPYAVLSAMTVPAIFFATQNIISATAGFVVAIILSFRNKSLLSVAAFACFAVFVCELAIGFIM